MSDSSDTNKQRFWDDYYRRIEQPWTAPDPLLMAQVDALLPSTPGSALELGSGQGANAIALAQAGWQMTAIDFSPQGIRTLQQQAANRGVTINAEVADLLTYCPAQPFDLIVCCFVHLPPADRKIMLANAINSLAPSGSFIYVGITGVDLAQLPKTADPACFADLTTLRAEWADADFAIDHALSAPRTVQFNQGQPPWAVTGVTVRARKIKV